MKYADINNRFTALVSIFLKEGYTINTATMCGNQSEIAKIDLVKGKDFFRVMIERDFSVPWSETIKISVGEPKDKSNLVVNSHDTWHTIWNNDLNIVFEEKFYEISEHRRNKDFYGTYEEAMSAQKIRDKRQYMKHRHIYKSYSDDEKRIEIAKRVIMRKTGMTRPRKDKIRIQKNCIGIYTIAYNDFRVNLK